MAVISNLKTELFLLNSNFKNVRFGIIINSILMLLIYYVHFLLSLLFLISIIAAFVEYFEIEERKDILERKIAQRNKRISQQLESEGFSVEEMEWIKDNLA